MPRRSLTYRYSHKQSRLSERMFCKVWYTSAPALAVCAVRMKLLIHNAMIADDSRSARMIRGDDP